MKITSSVCELSTQQGVAVLTLDSPPVNALSQRVCRALHAGLIATLADSSICSVVILCAGRTFFAGAEINELGKPPAGVCLHDVQAVMDGACKPIIAAIHGTALGGGLELALAAHYRVAVPSAQVGLPEVHLGLLPGGGGTQRLPRIVGVATALELITLGSAIRAARAHELGIIDELVDEGSLRDAAVSFARRVSSPSRELPRVRDRQDRVSGNTAHLFDEFRRRHAQTFRGFKAPENIIRAIEAAATLPFEEGMRREARLFQELLHSSESAAQRYVFFAERAAAKLPGGGSSTPPIPLNRIAVIGSGAAAEAISYSFIAAGLQVTRLRTQQLELDSIAGCDLVIEAEPGRAEWARELFARLGQVAPAAVLATSHYGADLERLAIARSWPDSVVGINFGSHARKTRLLEVIRGKRTAPATIATLMRLAKRLGKVAVLAPAREGFIADRLMSPCRRAQQELLREGITPQAIDHALETFGFASDTTVAPDMPGATDPTILQRLLYPVVNEGARILEERAAARASDIDIAAIYGHGWPVYRGGPLFWADSVGLTSIVEQLDALCATRGEYYRPTNLLRQLAVEKRSLHTQ